MDPARTIKSAVDLWAAGNHAAALDLARSVLQRFPFQPQANHLVGAGLAMQGRWADAAAHLERATKGEPGNPQYHFALGTVRGNMGDAEGAAAALERALSVAPGFVDAMVPLSLALIELGRSAEAEEVLRRALSRHPDWPDAVMAMAAVLTDRAQTVEAERLLRRSLTANPRHPAPLRMLCQTLNYLEHDPAEAKGLRARHAELLGAPVAMRPGSAPNKPDPQHRLRIGYLSPDFRRHSVAYFVESFLPRHDPTAVEVFCYPTGANEDQVTARLRAAAQHWRNAAGVPDAALYDLIRADQIDILVELSGLTAGGRPEVLARRAAPIQVTYIGSPCSTGVPAIDYRIVDEVTDPPGAEAHASERLIRLPGCFLSYRPPEDAPPVSPGPSAGGGPITFGSFNNLAKLSDGTVRLWARVVKEVSGSRLLLKGKALADPIAAASVRERFAGAGLEPERLELLGDIKSLSEHLAAYNRIDVALDPFPYNGTTTTCEALWMGAPAVTLAGSLHAGRVGASLLTAARVPVWIARDEDHYVRICSDLGADRVRLAELRSGLRAKVGGSRLCDGDAHARALEGAYRRMWEAWCAT